ncbi:flagellar L-ring protein precursor FlgH [Andreprevotia lacus DSM 23236]|jgi:flagellar L-ring protein precursor FlgH|uniref:Flagellar L-ring protein n=1 Tax=Andreprevotia lacus DSM 23236 TaxID=1121001 RepID=A0A1W1WYT6_9NEIS|nr:flagellar basal body L-ring protein FlgH [Andreprevotia lacus]SMC16825.1 flagellar L-ring protein precursor FlgH [Andreprevotia lacus DSM 23236]
MNRLRLGLVAALAVLLTACANPPSVVTGPVTAKPQPQLAGNDNPGAIYQPTSARMLFEERTAKYAGDILTITIEETLSASNKSDNAANRTSSLSYKTTGDLPFVPKQIEKFLTTNDASVGVTGANDMKGTGATNNSNTFKGSITVTVIEQLANGNVIVGGEKQIAINNQINTLRFTGVINPRDIQSGNVISSTKVADARIEQVGVGAMADATTMGWLQRFFLNVLPF